MKRSSRIVPSMLIIIVVGLLHPQDAYGMYLDPGSASLIVQAIIAGVVGVGTVLKLYWGKIQGWVKRADKKPDTP